MNRLIFSTLATLEFKGLQWLEYIEIFLKEYYLQQL